MLVLTTNHKIGDVVYVVDDCVRRGIVQQVNFTQSNSAFVLSYDILYDGFTFNTNVVSEVVFGVGSPTPFGSPETSSGSPFSGSPQLPLGVAVQEVENGGDIFTNKATALSAFGDTLA
jgi:hypothetical protein